MNRRTDLGFTAFTWCFALATLFQLARGDGLLPMVWFAGACASSFRARWWSTRCRCS